MSKQSTERDAKALCARMGEGWEPRVWENLGWHYTAVLPFGDSGARAEIREYENGGSPNSYRAEIYLNETGGAVGPERKNGYLGASFQFFGVGNDPHAALEEARVRMIAKGKCVAAAFERARSFVKELA